MSVRLALLLSLACLTPSLAWAAGDELTAEEMAALEACRQNRRCRLSLLRDEMIIQRREQAKKLQVAAEVDQRRIDQLKKDGQPIRRVREWSTDGFVSTTDTIGQGVLLGYGLNEQWRFELVGTLVSNSSYSTGSYYSASGQALMGRVRWIPLDTQLAPYVALGMQFQKHDYYSDTIVTPVPPSEANEGRDVVDPGFNYVQPEAFAHRVIPALGIDLQLRFGLHLGIELQYPITIYTQVRDPETRRTDTLASIRLKDGMKSEFAVGFIFGWAWDFL